MKSRKSYPDDLTNQKWKCIRDRVEAKENKTGRLHERREILNAIFYLLRTGCSWRHLPYDFPRWKSAYNPTFLYDGYMMEPRRLKGENVNKYSL